MSSMRCSSWCEMGGSVALQGLGSRGSSEPLPPAPTGAVLPPSGLVQDHEPKPGNPRWAPWARHSHARGELVFDPRCCYCSDALTDYVVRQRAPSELVLRYLRKLDQET
ncbi:MAG: hypothetical protein QOH48_2409 [Actinomycetota bacterium]|jgi:hypothetical protein|nr:hypothetical protein [Actinomycetota bacterium]